jgi:selenocysteine-specific elongation factor
MHVVATAGHVDHGKSALIHALTGMEPDRWAEERRRGMTIDLGFAWMTLPSGDQMAFVDVPGHERFVPNMLAGAGAVPAVLFVVAADEGWMPQSAEHLAVIDALGIRSGLLAVTKSDVADPSAAMAQASEQIARTRLGAVPAVAVSVVTGDGVSELTSELDKLAHALPEPDPGGPVRIWIDRAFSIAGSGTVVTGTLPAGTVHRGDELVISPAMRPVRVRDLQLLGEAAEQVSGTARVALNLRGVSKDALHRGMALIQVGRWTLTDVIDVRTVAVSAPPGPVPSAQPAPQLPRTVTVHAGSARVLARVRPLGGDLARLSLADPLPLHVGDRALLRDPGSRRDGQWPTVAGIIVLDVAPPALARRGSGSAAARLLASWPDQPGAGHLLARHGLLRASTLLAMGISEHPRPVAGEWLADPGRWHALGDQLGEVLARYAAAEPLSAGMPLDAARAALDLPDRRLVSALARPPFRVWCGALQIAQPVDRETGPRLPEPLQAALRVLRADLATAPFASPDADRLRKLGLDARSLAAAVRAGELMRISDQVVLAPGADKAAATILAGLPQPFTAAQAREALSTTRRTAIPLLEFLDRAGVTQRLADDRRVVRETPAEPALSGGSGPSGPGVSPGDPSGSAVPPGDPSGSAVPAGDPSGSGLPAGDTVSARDSAAAVSLDSGEPGS